MLAFEQPGLSTLTENAQQASLENPNALLLDRNFYRQQYQEAANELKQLKSLLSRFRMASQKQNSLLEEHEKTIILLSVCILIKNFNSSNPLSILPEYIPYIGCC